MHVQSHLISFFKQLVRNAMEDVTLSSVATAKQLAEMMRIQGPGSRNAIPLTPTYHQ